jgi:putative redox protein
MATSYALTAHLGEGYKTDTSIRSHKLTLDEPAPNGADAGPLPFEALLAALAGCTAMTLRAYANHKKIALDGVDLEYTLTRRDPSEVPQGGKTVVIKKKLKFSAAVPAELRQKLLEIAAKCPVNKTLLEGCEITGELA